MKIKNLLVLALTLFGTAFTAQAQVVKEDFSAPQTKAATDQGYYEFINLQPNEGEKVDKWTVADGVLNIENSADYPCSGQKWQRAIKFRNLPFKEKTFYKLSLDLTTNETYIDSETSTEAPGYLDMKIMQGDENADICILGANLSEQRINYTLNAGDSKKYSKVFYYASKTKQDSAYQANCAGKELYDPAKYFVGINVYSPGKYVLDNVLLEEATAIDSIGFYGQAIKVYYGDQLNATALCAGKKQYVLDNSCAKVTINGEAADIVSVEVKADGYLYVFVDNELSTADVVKVSFKAPAEVQFTGSYAGASLDFSDVQAIEDETIDATSWLMDEAELVSSVPVDGNFNLDQLITDFTFTFDKPVYTIKTDAGEAPVAKLSNGETLKLLTTEELSKVLAFQRPSNDSLAKGSYTVTLQNIFNEYGTAHEGDITVSFEVGKAQVAETVYSEYTTSLLQGENGSQPTGWSIMVGGSDYTGGEPKADDGSACRNINVTGTDGNSYTAFYICDRAGYTYMQSPETALPKGNIEFSLLAMSHDAASSSRTVEYRIEDLNGTVIATGSGVTSIGTDNFTTPDATSIATIKFENPAEQNVIIKIRNTAGAWEGARVLGFRYRTYTMTQGEVFVPEVVAEGNFAGWTNNNSPKLGTGWKMYGSNGIMKNADQSCGWGGAERSITDGSRVLSVNMKNFNGMAMYYAAANAYSTYGQFNNQTEREGEVTDPETGQPIPEKVLKLKNAKYQVTYYIGGWHNNDQSVKFEIFNFDDGVSGTPVYSRSDAVTSNNDVSGAEANKIQFFWSAPTAGQYIIKVTSEKGECLFGNMAIQTTASLAVQYAQMMNEALEPAKAELALANADDKYAGVTRDALAKAIKDYTNPDFHSVAEYDEAIANVNALIKKSQARRDNVDKYPTYIQNIEILMSEVVGTKYQKLEAYKALNEVYSQYKDVNPTDIVDDDELASTTEKLNNYYTLLSNMVKTGVGLLTQQIDNLAAKLDPEDADVIRTAEAITDDQELAYILKLKNLKALYDKLAAPQSDTLFTKIDPETSLEVTDSIELTDFIQNANLYSTCPTRDLTDYTNIPGWKITNYNGGISQQWSWSAWSGSEFCPINNVFLLNGWYGDFTIEQNVSLLPVGSYRYVSGTQDRGFADTSDDKTAALDTRDHWTVTGTDGTNEITGEIFSYIYWQSGEVRDSVPFDITNQGQWYDLTNDNSKPIAVNQAGDQPYGELLIGSRAVSYQSSASVDNFKIYMTGKKEGFDYAAAAAAVQKLINGLVLTGDADNDGRVDVSDITTVASFILGKTPASWNEANADADKDGEITVSDITTIATIILTKAKKQMAK